MTAEEKAQALKALGWPGTPEDFDRLCQKKRKLEAAVLQHAKKLHGTLEMNRVVGDISCAAEALRRWEDPNEP